MLPVIEAISRNVEYTELGFPCSYLASKINRGITGKRIATDDEKRVAQNLLKKYREFVRDRLDVNEDKYEAIDAIFKEFYDIISREHHDASIETKTIDDKSP